MSYVVVHVTVTLWSFIVSIKYIQDVPKRTWSPRIVEYGRFLGAIHNTARKNKHKPLEKKKSENRKTPARTVDLEFDRNAPVRITT